jgi:hypothetical protein
MSIAGWMLLHPVQRWKVVIRWLYHLLISAGGFLSIFLSGVRPLIHLYT